MPSDVVFTVLFMKQRKYLASPTVLREYGQVVRLEVPGEMQALVEAHAPAANGTSYTRAQFALYRDHAWQIVEDMSMPAHLGLTPSFEYSVPGTPYRFVVMPRKIVPAAGA